MRVSIKLFRQYRGPTVARRIKAMTNVNRAAPITDHTIGKGFPCIVMVKNSGKPNRPAIHIPMYAPMNPTMIETRHPPKLYPARDWPIPPHIAAINKSTRNPNNVMREYLVDEKVHQILLK